MLVLGLIIFLIIFIGYHFYKVNVLKYHIGQVAEKMLYTHPKDVNFAIMDKRDLTIKKIKSIDFGNQECFTSGEGIKFNDIEVLILDYKDKGNYDVR